MKLLLAMIGLALSGFLGAYLSILARREVISSFWILLATAGSTLVWLWQTKYKGMSMAQASVLFDVVYGLSYFVGFMLLGEVSRWQDWVGMGLAFLGLLITCL